MKELAFNVYMILLMTDNEKGLNKYQAFRISDLISYHCKM